MNGDLLGLHGEVDAIARCQPQLGGGLGGDVGGKPRRTVGLLVGAHADRRLRGCRVRRPSPRRCCGGCHAACRGTRRPPQGVNTATADCPATTSGAGLPCQTVPHCVVSTPSAPAVPLTRFTPANRAPNRLRGVAKTVAAEPVSTILPASSISTRSARVSTSSRSWVISTAERPSRASTRRSTLRIAVAAETSSPANGSSSSSTSGSAASARASATRWACPPDSCRGIRSARSAASTSASQCAAAARELRGANATLAGRRSDAGTTVRPAAAGRRGDRGWPRERPPRCRSAPGRRRAPCRVWPHQARDHVQ